MNVKKKRALINTRGANARGADETASSIFLWSGIAGGVLGLIGYALQSRIWTDLTLVNALLDLSDTVYKTVKLYSFSSDIPALSGGGWRDALSVTLLHLARYLAPVSLYGTILRLTLKLTSSHRLRSRLARMTGHTVICGLGETGRRFLGDLPEDEACVVIEGKRIEEARLLCRQFGAELVEGDPKEAALLQMAVAARARRLLIVPEDESAGLEIAAALPALIEARRDETPLKTYIEIRDDALLKELTDRDAFIRPSSRIELRPFNLAALTARRFFAQHNIMAAARMSDQERIHLVLAGFDSAALQLLLQLARLCPFEGLAAPLVTILVASADACREALRASYPELLDDGPERMVELALLSWPAGSNLITPAVMQTVEAKTEITAIAVSLGDDALNARTALMLRTLSQREARWRAPIYVNQSGAAKFGHFAKTSDDLKRGIDIIMPFGEAEEVCRWAEIEGAGDDLAIALHEGYLAQQAARGTLGAARRPSELDWASLSETFRRANRRAADHLPVKLASAGFHITGAPIAPAQPLALSERELTGLARLEHQSWANGQRLAGWRYGPVRDDQRRVHDALKPFDALSAEVQSYDLDQVKLIAEKIIQPDPHAPTLFRDHWLGLGAAAGASPPEHLAPWLHSEVMPALMKQTEGGWLTIVSALLPGPGLALAEAVLAALDANARGQWRLLALDLLPEAMLGLLPEAESDALARRAGILARPELDRIVDLTPPGLWLEDWRQNTGGRIAAAISRGETYLRHRCAAIILPTAPDTSPEEGDPRLYVPVISTLIPAGPLPTTQPVSQNE